MRGAAKRGTAVHTLVENYLNNEELSKQDVLPVALFTLLKPELDNINSIRMQEGGLYSDKWEVAGRVDCIGLFNNTLSIIDFKSSSKVKEEYMQESRKFTSQYSPYNQSNKQIYMNLLNES